MMKEIGDILCITFAIIVIYVTVVSQINVGTLSEITIERDKEHPEAWFV